jgi:glutamate 5-kinase
VTRLVVKIGTNVLTDERGAPDLNVLAELVRQLAALRGQGRELIVVSSGAVSVGRSLMPGLDHLHRVQRRQVQAALGQARLMQLYQELFAPFGCHVAQVLATKEDFRDRRHYLNMRHCLQGLSRGDIIPIVNENDVVAITELMFTDNDELAGLVAAMVNAEALVVLSSVDGLYAGAPGSPESQLIEEIRPGDKQYAEFILPTTSAFGRGGMHTKYRVASKAAALGIDVFIANGKRPGILLKVLNGEGPRTRFTGEKKASNVKKWLAHRHEASKGDVHINEGAMRALSDPGRVSSLLPVGVSQVEGDFEKGDLLRILYENKEIAIGIAQYGAAAARERLGVKGAKPLVHYDYLLLV